MTVQYYTKQSEKHPINVTFKGKYQLYKNFICFQLPYPHVFYFSGLLQRPSGILL